MAAARGPFPPWSTRPHDSERQRLLHAVGDALEKNMPALMELVTKETGKPLKGLNDIGAGMEVGGAVAWTHATADLTLPVEVIQDNEEARIEVHRKPLGVVGSITPWNWPLLIAIWHVIPALRAGNTVVIKPSALTPVATAKFVELSEPNIAAGNFKHCDRDLGFLCWISHGEAPGHRQDHLHRLHRHGQKDHAGWGAQSQTSHTGAGWERRRHCSAGRGSTQGDHTEIIQRHFSQQRPDVRLPETSLCARKHL